MVHLMLENRCAQNQGSLSLDHSEVELPRLEGSGAFNFECTNESNFYFVKITSK